MFKMILIFAFAALFTSVQSADFICTFLIDGSFFGTHYRCEVKNAVNITSYDPTQNDTFTGTHQAGFNNDNVESLSVAMGQIQYFPRGITKTFKNIRAVQITGVGLKEIHQSDLKDLPKLTDIYLSAGKLEIIEENLFAFNPNLESILLPINQISHIDPNVFDKLTKLTTLYLSGSLCINSNTWKNRNEVMAIISKAKAQCTNPVYATLVQRVKSLLNESISLNSVTLKAKIDTLQNDIQSANYTNFFLNQIQDLRATQALKESQETTTTIPTTTTTTIPTTSTTTTTTIPTTTTTTVPTTTTTTIPTTTTRSVIQTCTAIESQLDLIAANLNEKIAILSQKFTSIEDKFLKINETMAKVDEIFRILKQLF